MIEPVGCWSGDLEPTGPVTRAMLGPVAKFSDSEIDKLYAMLVSLEESAERDAEQIERLVEKIRVAEEERSAEMSAFFGRAGASIDSEGLRELLAKVDEALGR